MENFSIRTQSLLMNAGIKSLQELSEYTAADLLKFRNFGYKSLQEVEPYLKTFDFTIKSDNTQTLQNSLEKIEKLEAEKKELLEALEKAQNELSQFKESFGQGSELIPEIESLIQKMKK